MLKCNWDCKIPQSVNDLDMRAETTQIPIPESHRPTEASFVVIRNMMHDLSRNPDHSTNVAEATSTASTGKRLQSASKLSPTTVSDLANSIERNHLAHCDPANPFHFMIIYFTRGYLAKLRLKEYWIRTATLTDTQKDEAVGMAIKLLECDTKLLQNSAIKGYRWYLEVHFPVPGYVHLLQNIKQRPNGPLVARAWEAMSNHYIARELHLESLDHLFFKLIPKMVLQAWNTTCAGSMLGDEPESMPFIVSNVRQRMKQFYTSSSGSTSQVGDLAPFVNNSAADVQSILSIDTMSLQPISVGHEPWNFQEFHGQHSKIGDESGWCDLDWNELFPANQLEAAASFHQ